MPRRTAAAALLTPLADYRWPASVSESLLRQFRKTITRYRDCTRVLCIDIGFRSAPVVPVRTEALTVRIHFADRVARRLLPTQRPHAMLQRRVMGLSANYALHGAPRQSASAGVLTDRTRMQDVIQPGISIMSDAPRSSYGTLGLIVTPSTERDNPQLLSCWHVLGERPTPGEAPPVRQGDSEADRKVATLATSFVEASGDLAVATVNVDRRSSLAAQQWDAGTVTGVAAPQLGAQVTKSGIATGNTCGIIDGIGVYLHRSRTPGGAPVLVDCFRVVTASRDPIARPGDSGAVWCAAGGTTGVGVHFAGSPNELDPTKNYAIAAHLDRAMQRLDLALWP
jgi:hypothetical protein